MRRYPPWLRKSFSPDGTARMVRGLVADLELVTVCESALCPNLRECYSQRQLTFMILGDRCTRRCRFCAVAYGKPRPVEADEPQRVAEAVRRLGLEHVIITSVARDELPDEGAGHFVQVIEAVRASNPGVTVEVLVPDFHGRRDLIEQVMAARPEVFAHNLETVERLTPLVRWQAQYRRSLDVLRVARSSASAGALIKSSLMLGLGESAEEVRQAFADLVEAGCTHLTLGQYLQPTPQHLPVAEYLSPERFRGYDQLASEAGFQWITAGPFVRSSYHAIDAVNSVRHQNHMVSDTVLSKSRLAAGGESFGERHVGIPSGHGVPPQAGRARNSVERTAARWAAGAMPRTECEPGPAARRPWHAPVSECSTEPSDTVFGGS